MRDFTTLAIALFLGVFWGWYLTMCYWSIGTKDCAATNNVYQCEWVAVPKQKGK